MKNATRSGKLDAGNSHMMFDEEEVGSGKPMRGPLLYKKFMFVLALVAKSALATTYYVDGLNGDESATGLEGAPVKTIATGVSKTTAAGDVVCIAGGQTYVLSSSIVIPRSGIELRGTGSTRPVIDGNGSCRLINANKTKNLVFANLVLCHGTGMGAAIGASSGEFNPPMSGSWTITNCLFEANATGGTVSGGALWSDGAVRVVDCAFRRNSCGRSGGAVLLRSYYGDAVFERCTFEENVSGDRDGGAIAVNLNHNNGSEISEIYGLIARECTFTSNHTVTTSSSYGGGAISGFVKLAEDCVFKANWTQANTTTNVPGGAILTAFNDATRTNVVRHCAFIGNCAYGSGGAIYTTMAAWRVEGGCTFAGNESYGDGPVFGWGNDSRIPSVSISDSTFRANFGRFPTWKSGNQTQQSALVHLPPNSSVVNCRFIDNETVGYSSALGLGNGASVAHSVFVGNKIILDPVTPTIFGSTHTGGTVVFAESGTMTDCVFSNNTTVSVCAGVRGLNSTVIDRCAFVSNKVLQSSVANTTRGEGYVATLTGTNLVFRNCLVVGNENRQTTGPAVAVNGVNNVVNDNIIMNATFLKNGGLNGPFGLRAFPLGDGTTIANLILFGDYPVAGSTWQPDNQNDAEVNVYTRQIIANSYLGPSSAIMAISAGTRGCIVGDDARFANASKGDYRIVKASACRDAGQEAAWMTGAKDLSGKTDRIVGDHPDIGCYEWFQAKSGLMLLLR